MRPHNFGAFLQRILHNDQKNLALRLYTLSGKAGNFLAPDLARLIYSPGLTGSRYRPPEILYGGTTVISCISFYNKIKVAEQKRSQILGRREGPNTCCQVSLGREALARTRRLGHARS